MKAKHKLHKRTPINNVNISLVYLEHVLKDWKVFCKTHPHIKQAIQNILDYVKQLSNEKEEQSKTIIKNTWFIEEYKKRVKEKVSESDAKIFDDIEQQIIKELEVVL